LEFLKKNLEAFFCWIHANSKKRAYTSESDLLTSQLLNYYHQSPIERSPSISTSWVHQNLHTSNKIEIVQIPATI